VGPSTGAALHIYIGDGMEEMDLATGTFTNTTPTEDDQEARIVAELLGSDNDSVDGEDGKLEDEVPCEFEAPSIPNDDMNLLLAQRTVQVEGTQDTSPVPANRTPTIACAIARTPMPTSRGSTSSARPLVSPHDRRGSNRNNPQHDGLMQMMQMSMLQAAYPVHGRRASASWGRTRRSLSHATDACGCSWWGFCSPQKLHRQPGQSRRRRVEVHNQVLISIVSVNSPTFSY
jgi:hypothetical protein